jgi:RNA polymerase sigma-70 factor (ECF subfamily)
MRRLLDSLDVCQSVFARFFVHVTNGQYDLQNPRQLALLLRTMAQNKILDQFRKQATSRRGGATAVVDWPTLDWVADTAVAPTQAVENRELVDLLLARLSADDQLLVDRWMKGEDWQAIAAQAGGSSEAVRKRLTRAIDRAAQELGWEETS